VGEIAPRAAQRCVHGPMGTGAVPQQIGQAVFAQETAVAWATVIFQCGRPGMHCRVVDAHLSDANAGRSAIPWLW
jgi:hypothetical protein